MEKHSLLYIHCPPQRERTKRGKERKENMRLSMILIDEEKE
jgi:hypothetical protein